jgi:hypothetical protein
MKNVNCLCICGLPCNDNYFVLFGTRVYLCDSCYGDVKTRYLVLKDQLDKNAKKDMGLLWDEARDKSFRVNGDSAAKPWQQYQRRDAFMAAQNCLKTKEEK